MKNYTIRDLNQFGIESLTGEACAYSMRMLCDLNQEGVDLICDYFGLASGNALAKNWNSEVDERPAIASIMIENSSFRPLLRFAIFRLGHDTLVFPTEHADIVFALNRDAPEDRAILEQLQNNYIDCIVYRTAINPGQPRVASRNVHAFTERAV